MSAAATRSSRGGRLVRRVSDGARRPDGATPAAAGRSTAGVDRRPQRVRICCGDATAASAISRWPSRLLAPPTLVHGRTRARASIADERHGRPPSGAQAGRGRAAGGRAGRPRHGLIARSSPWLPPDDAEHPGDEAEPPIEPSRGRSSRSVRERQVAPPRRETWARGRPDHAAQRRAHATSVHHPRRLLAAYRSPKAGTACMATPGWTSEGRVDRVTYRWSVSRRRTEGEERARNTLELMDFGRSVAIELPADRGRARARTFDPWRIVVDLGPRSRPPWLRAPASSGAIVARPRSRGERERGRASLRRPTAASSRGSASASCCTRPCAARRSR